VQQSAREAHARALEKETLMQLASGADSRSESGRGNAPARTPRYARGYLSSRRIGRFRPRRKIVGRATG
jgi:hypothetical protein